MAPLPKWIVCGFAANLPQISGKPISLPGNFWTCLPIFASSGNLLFSQNFTRNSIMFGAFSPLVAKCWQIPHNFPDADQKLFFFLCLFYFMSMPKLYQKRNLIFFTHFSTTLRMSFIMNCLYNFVDFVQRKEYFHIKVLFKEIFN